MGKIYIFSGAGISAPSGISTFRDSNGLWENHSIDEVCNYPTWIDNYEKVHKFYNDRRLALEDKLPNKAHLKIAEWQERYGEENVINITQNIDNLFEKAGVKNTIHIHGELTKLECRTCYNIFDIGYQEFNKETKCPKCQRNYLKPFVIFFGEEAPKYEDSRKNLNSITSEDILIIIGTMGNIYPIEHYLRYIKHSNRQRPLFILNNMERSSYIPEGYFGDNKENIFYESCIDAIDKIDELVKSKLENKV